MQHLIKLIFNSFFFITLKMGLSYHKYNTCIFVRYLCN